MPAIEAVAASIGGDDALNADLLGSLRDTVRHRDFSRPPRLHKSRDHVRAGRPHPRADASVPEPS